MRDLEAALGSADAVAQGRLRAELAALRAAVRSEKLGEVAAEFEAVHDIERARQVSSVYAIIPAAELWPRLIEAVERGMERVAGPWSASGLASDPAAAGSGRVTNRWGDMWP